MTKRTPRAFRPSFDSLGLRITPTAVTPVDPTPVATVDGGATWAATGSDLECGAPYIMNGPLENPLLNGDHDPEPYYAG